MELKAQQVVEGCIEGLETVRIRLESIKAHSRDSAIDSKKLDDPVYIVQEVIGRLKGLLETPKFNPVLGSGTALACDDRQEDRSSC